MSALRSLQRAQLWNNTSGYVCHSCRQKLQLQLGRRQLTRSQTHLSAHESSGGGGGDDWFSNFNDLSDIASPSSKKSQADKDKDELGSGYGVKRPSSSLAREREKVTDGDSFKRIPHDVLARTRRADGEEVGKKETEVVKKDALSPLVDELEKKVTPPSRASGSPSFSRIKPIPQSKPRLSEKEMRDMARQVRSRVAALQALQDTDEPKAAEVLKRLEREDPATLSFLRPPHFPPLAQVAEGVGRNGLCVQAEKYWQELAALEKSGEEVPTSHQSLKARRARMRHDIFKRLQRAFGSKVLAEVARQSQTTVEGDREELAEEAIVAQNASEEQPTKDKQGAVEKQSIVEDEGQNAALILERDKHLRDLKSMIFDSGASKEDVERAISQRASILAELRYERMVRERALGLSRRRSRSISHWEWYFAQRDWNMREKVLARSDKANSVAENADQEGAIGEAEEEQTSADEPNLEKEDTAATGTPMSQQKNQNEKLWSVLRDKDAPHEDVVWAISEIAQFWHLESISGAWRNSRSAAYYEGQPRRLREKLAVRREETDAVTEDGDHQAVAEESRKQQSSFEGEKAVEQQSVPEQNTDLDATSMHNQTVTKAELMSLFEDERARHEVLQRMISLRAAATAEDKMRRLFAFGRTPSGRRCGSPTTLSGWKLKHERGLWKLRDKVLARRAKERAGIVFEDRKAKGKQEQILTEQQSLAKEEHGPMVTPMSNQEERIRDLVKFITTADAQQEDLDRAISVIAAISVESKMAEPSIPGRYQLNNPESRTPAQWQYYFEKRLRKYRAKSLARRKATAEVMKNADAKYLSEDLGEHGNAMDIQNVVMAEDAVDGSTDLDGHNDTKVAAEREYTFDDVIAGAEGNEAFKTWYKHREISLTAAEMAKDKLARDLASGDASSAAPRSIESLTEEFEERLWRKAALMVARRDKAAGLTPSARYIPALRVATADKSFPMLDGDDVDADGYVDFHEPLENEVLLSTNATSADRDSNGTIVKLNPIGLESAAASLQDEQSRKFEETLQKLMPSIQDILARATGAKQKATQTAETQTTSSQNEAMSSLVDINEYPDEDKEVASASDSAIIHAKAASNDSLEYLVPSTQDVFPTFTADEKQLTATSTTQTPAPAESNPSTGIETPSFPITTSRLWSEWDTPIPPPNGAKPPPQKPPIFTRSPKNPFASPISPLSKSETPSLAKQVWEADSRPKWGGVSNTSRVEPLIPRSTVSDVVQAGAEELRENGPFRPFGLNHATPSESGSGNAKFLDSLQKSTRFDVAASSSSASSKASNDLADHAKRTEPSDSKTPITSWLWNKLVGKPTTQDANAKGSEPQTPANPGALQDLNEQQQKLSGEMLPKSRTKGLEATKPISPDTSMSVYDRAAAVPKLEQLDEKAQIDKQTSLTSPGIEQVNEQRDTEERYNEADASSPSGKYYHSTKSFFRTNRTDSNNPLEVARFAHLEKHQPGTVHRPLDSGRLGALAELNEELVYEASSTLDENANASEVVGRSAVDANGASAIGKHPSSEPRLNEQPPLQREANPASTAFVDVEKFTTSPSRQSSCQLDNEAELEPSERLASLYGLDLTSNESRHVDGSQGGRDATAGNDHRTATRRTSSTDLENEASRGTPETAATEVGAEHSIHEKDNGNVRPSVLADERRAKLAPSLSLPSRMRSRLRMLFVNHLRAARAGEPVRADYYLAKHDQLLRELSQNKANDVPPSEASSAQGVATSEFPNNSIGGHDAPGSGGNGSDGSDDGDDKPLWEVMSKAQAFSTADFGPASQNEQIEPKESTEADEAPLDLSRSEPSHVSVIKPLELEVKPLNIPQPPVPALEYGLDRVLFNPGVYQLQDPFSRVYNFDPYLQKIMPVVEFDFNALKEYKTSSQDTMLSALANEHGKRYIGSTSSMTGMLGHFHYLLSDWRPLNLNMLSRGFNDRLDSFTMLNRAPNAIFLRWKNGTYAVDADKQYDSGNVLMLLGKSMEKLLTTPTSEYERYRKSDPRTVSEEERTAPEAFEYTTMGDFLMRSQLDAYDPRLPGTGMFDLKTRAVLSVRMDSGDFQPMTGYEIYSLQGRFQSYEREFYDMMRSTMLKYMLQARMGRMDGIFIAYHNVERIFGFQYLPIPEMDRSLHGQLDRCLGDQEFKTSLDLVNKVFDKATAKFPEQSLRFHFETTTESLGGTPTAVMWIFAEPMTDSEIDRLQSTSKEKVEEFERSMMGVEKEAVSATAEAASPEVPQDFDSVIKADSAASAASELSSTLSSTSSEYISSHAEGDAGFLDAMTNATALNVKPLFAASLICKSKVNGIPTQRPENLKPSDVWEIEYLLREWDAPDRMWPRYEQMKARRQEMFEKLKNEEEAGEGNGNGELSSKQKRDRAFIDLLRSMSQRDREWRSRLEKAEAGKEPVIVGQPLRTSSNVEEEGVGSVDQYTAWLYGKERS